ncbi:MAG TPA: DUF2306 domain-containing protein [Allosphingosinicella sp.]|jgi:uncharacterized membrane protein
MAVLDRVDGGGWARPAAALGIATAATLLFWGLSLLIERPDGWRPPAGADVALYIHLFTVIPAVPLGAVVLWRTKGGRVHRLLGRIWGALMMVTAVSSFWLQSLSGGLSFIHLFAVLTLISIPLAVWNARRGNIRAHRNAMRGVYAGLIAAGLLAVLPGRTLGTLLFG